MRRIIAFVFSVVLWQAGGTAVSAQHMRLVEGEVHQSDFNDKWREFWQFEAEFNELITLEIEQIGFDVSALILGPDGSGFRRWVDESSTGAKEKESWLVEVPGTYTVVAYNIDDSNNKPGLRYSIAFESSPGPKVVLEGSSSVWNDIRSELTEEIHPMSFPIKTIADEELSYLKEMVGHAKVVMLGEATHGSREIFQLKGRIVKYLMEYMGFNVLIFETPMTESFMIQDYVRLGNQDLEEAFAATRYWTDNVETKLELAQWMREFNSGLSATEQVSFIGNDVIHPRNSYWFLIDNLTPIAPDLASQLASDSLIATLGRGHSVWEFFTVDHDVIMDKQKLLRELKASYILENGEDTGTYETHDLILLHFDLLHDTISYRMNHEGMGRAHRDSSMAKNTQWVMERRGAENKAIVWAHNGHVEKTAFGSNLMGEVLTQAYGDSIKSFAFMVGRGSFQSRGISLSNRSVEGAQSFFLADYPSGSLDALFSQVPASVFAFDNRSLDRMPKLSDWISNERVTKSVGAFYEPDSTFGLRLGRFVNLKSEHDGFFFVRNTTAARPAPSGREATTRLLEEFSDLSFEHDPEGRSGTYWNLQSERFEPFGYDISISRDEASDGIQSLRIQRTKTSRPVAVEQAAVEQRYWSQFSEDRTVHVRVSVKTSGLGSDSAASIQLRAGSCIRSSTATRPAHNWHDIEAECFVTSDTTEVLVVLGMEGSGTVYFDDVRVEWSE